MTATAWWRLSSRRWLTMREWILWRWSGPLAVPCPTRMAFSHVLGPDGEDAVRSCTEACVPRLPVGFWYPERSALYVAAPATTLSRSKTWFLMWREPSTTKRVCGRVELGAAWVSSLSSCLSLSSTSAAYPGMCYAPYIQQAGGSFFSSLDQFNSFFWSLCRPFKRGEDLRCGHRGVARALPTRSVRGGYRAVLWTDCEQGVACCGQRHFQTPSPRDARRHVTRLRCDLVNVRHE